jgi:hypothetical protein
LFGKTEEFLNLGLQLLLEFAGMLPTQGMVFGGIGFDLGAIQADFAKLSQAHLMGKHQDLDKKWLQLSRGIACGKWR